MSNRPSHPPPISRADVSDAERAAITDALGPLPDDLLHAVRDARGLLFQRLELYGDAVLELVVRMHSAVAGTSCERCRGDADRVVTDDALAERADEARLHAWLEWEPSRERRADLVEACAGAVQLASGWAALARFVDEVVHPLDPLTPDLLVDGRPGVDLPPVGRAREVLGASVIEVAAAGLAYRTVPGGPDELTDERNRLYATGRVVDRARGLGLLPARPDTGRDRVAEAADRDALERVLATLAAEQGLAAAVEEAERMLVEVLST